MAEVAVIAELPHLNDASLIFNDVSIEAERYIHFGAKPLQSAQIDTLAITTAGVFVIENWSGEFAHSGEGFSPYEQVPQLKTSLETPELNWPGPFPQLARLQSGPFCPSQRPRPWRIVRIAHGQAVI